MALDTNLFNEQSAGSTTKFGLGWFIPHSRSIGGIVADVTIEENERDDVTITEHPVEQGAPISDHAFKRPEEVIIRAGWNIQNNGDLSAETGVYGILLNWQAAFVPFDLYTGKRRHQNMLIASLAVTTDSHSEYSLMATLSCRQIILTNTQTEQSSFSGNANAHQNPGSTAGSVEIGEIQIEPVGSSEIQDSTAILPPTIPNTSNLTSIAQSNIPAADMADKGLA